MAMGMSPEEFWHGPFDLAASYRRAWEIRRDSRLYEEWRLGIYVREAFSTVMDHAFNKNATSEYPDAPLFLSGRAREEADEARRRASLERMRDRIAARAAALNKKLDREQGEAAGG